MIAQEGCPFLGRGPTRLPDHVFADGSLGDANSQFLEFPVNARCAPQRFGAVHLLDQGNDVRGNGPPAGFARTTLPPPKEAKTRSMPLDDDVRLKHSKRHFPSVPGVGEPDPECSVQWREAGALGASVQDEQLVMQSQVSQQQVPAGFQRRGCEAEEQNQPNNYAVKDSRNGRRNPAFSTRMELLPTTGFAGGDRFVVRPPRAQLRPIYTWKPI